MLNPDRQTVLRPLLPLIAALCLHGAHASPAGPDAAPAPAPTAVTAPTQAAPAQVAAPARPAAESRALFPENFRPVAAGTQPSPAPGAVDATGWRALLPMLGPLALVLVVIFVLAMVLKRATGNSASFMAARAPAGLLEVLGRYPVGRGQTLLLLKLDQRIVLMGQSAPTRSAPGSMSTITELTDPQDVAAILLKVAESEGTGPAARFTSMLRDAEHTGTPKGVRGALHALAARVMPARPVVWDERLLPDTEPEALSSNAPAQPAARTGTTTDLRARLHALRGEATPRLGGAQ